jgi:hypothetical protein
VSSVSLWLKSNHRDTEITEKDDEAEPVRRQTLIRLLLITAGGAWFLAPLWLIPSGGGEFRNHPDSAIREVAAAAHQAARMHNDNPIGRLLFPAARVTRVWRDPGHCPATEPGGREPHADYRAEVRLYTYFGVPGKTLQVTCGGWAW